MMRRRASGSLSPPSFPRDGGGGSGGGSYPEPVDEALYLRPPVARASAESLTEGGGSSMQNQLQQQSRFLTRRSSSDNSVLGPSLSLALSRSPAAARAISPHTTGSTHAARARGGTVVLLFGLADNDH